MKKIVLYALILFAAMSCRKFDDSAIWKSLKEQEERITKLETLCGQLNTNIISLQTIIAALQNNDYITNVAPINSNGVEIGFTITFAKRGSITIYHGQDGKNGENGKDGVSPIISVRQDTDGVYYWTLNGEWILDSTGNKIPTSGKDGIDGTSALTPKLKIEDDYWYVSYDNGATWEKLGKATGENGKDVDISQDENNCYITLPDGTVITLIKNCSSSKDIIHFADYRVKMLCVANWDADNDYEISKAEAAAVKTLGDVFKADSDIFMFDELQYFTGLTEIEESTFEQCLSLISIRIPKNVKSIGCKAFWKCKKLKHVAFDEESSLLSINGGVAPFSGDSKLYESIGAFAYCSSLEDIHFPSSLQVIGSGAFFECESLTTIDFTKSSALKVIEGNDNIYHVHNSVSSNKEVVYSAFGAFSKTGLKSITIPSTVTYIGAGTFSKSKLETVVFESGVNLSSLNSIVGKNSYNEYLACYYDGVFSDCVYLKEIIIPKSVKSISPAAFKNCTSLISLVFEKDSQLEIVGGSFQTMNYCGNSLGTNGAFMNCTSLESLSLPSSVTTIGKGAFQGCVKLKNVEIQGKASALTIEGDYCTHSPSSGGCRAGAFKDCTSLEEIKLWKSKPPYISKYIFDGVSLKNVTLKVPYDYASAYKTAAYWKEMTIKVFYD